MSSLESLIDMFDVMERQEECIYRTKSGLYDDNLRKIDAGSRCLMIQWCLQIANHFEFEYRSVAIAINLLDRYVAKRPEILDEISEFQLVAMAALYTAVKTHESNGISAEYMQQICDEKFSSEEIERTELQILLELGWHVNSPTAFSFAGIFMKLIANAGILTLNQWNTMEKLIDEQIDSTFEESLFLGISACDVAFAATCNAALLVAGPTARIKTYQCIRNSCSVNLLPLSLGNLLLKNASTSESLQEKSEEVSIEKTNEQLPNVSTHHHDASPRCVAASREKTCIR